MTPQHASADQKQPMYTSIEICAGAGGQAVGLHQAGFAHLALVEIDKYAIETLELNIQKNEDWAWELENCDILSTDVKEFNPFEDLKKRGKKLKPGDLDLLAGGVPCPPFSHAGKQLGKDDERDLFPRMLELVEILQPKAVMIENVRGIMDLKFSDYRTTIKARLIRGDRRSEDGQLSDEKGPGYTINWDVLEASDFGVPQLRPRSILVAFRNDVIGKLRYTWPKGSTNRVSVAASLADSMQERFSRYEDDPLLEATAKAALKTWNNKVKDGGVAPTLVGGSKKHGGADLGPSRAKAAWKQLGISGMGVANDIETCARKRTEERDLFGPDGPLLTVQQAAIIQGFPENWEFSGGKTAQYKQVGNAFPPPVAKAVGESIIDILARAREHEQPRTPKTRKARTKLANTDQLPLDFPAQAKLRAS